MGFVKTVLNGIESVFHKYNVQIIEERSNYLKLESEHLSVVIGYNHLEKSSTLWIGQKNEKGSSVEIDNYVLQSFFHSELKLSQVPVEVFIDNLVLFFETEGQILITNPNRLRELQEFDLNRSRKYTNDLLHQRELKNANKAWENKDYKDLINILDKIGIDKLASSYQLKYTIAKRNEASAD